MTNTSSFWSYSYGQYSLLKNDISMQYDSIEDTLTINNYYHPSHQCTHGTCSELANHHALVEMNNFRTVFIASCSEKNYFPDGAHYAVIANNSGYRIPSHGITGELVINTIVEHGTYFFDPSFNRMGPWHKMKDLYSITHLINPSDKVKSPHAVFNRNMGNTKPLGFDGDRLISIGLEPGEDSLFVYGCYPGTADTPINSVDKINYKHVRKREIQAMIERLARTPVQRNQHDQGEFIL